MRCIGREALELDEGILKALEQTIENPGRMTKIIVGIMNRQSLTEPLGGNLFRASNHEAERRKRSAGYREHDPRCNDHGEWREQRENPQEAKYIHEDWRFVIAEAKEKRTAVEQVIVTYNQHLSAIA